MYYGPMMNGYDWGWGVLLTMLWFTFFIVIAVLIARQLKGHTIGSAEKADPLDIAKERYAKGEITKEQFEQLKIDLSK